MGPRIALLGFSIECNRFAPVATEADFAPAPCSVARRCWTRRARPPRACWANCPASSPRWMRPAHGRPVPIVLAMAEPNGPVDQVFFDRLMAQWETGLRAAGKLDGVYCVLHGAGLTTQDHDPKARFSAWFAASPATRFRWSPPTTCTRTSPTPTSRW